MKSLVVGMVLLLCFVLTLSCIFVCDTYSIKTAEMSQIETVVFSSLAKEFFDGTLTAFNIESETVRRVQEVTGSRSDVAVSVSFMNIDKKIISFDIELVYKQASGIDRKLSSTKTFIQERPQAGYDYVFLRAISKEFYFYDEDGGGPRENSIWRTAEYQAVLKTALKVGV